MNLQVLFSRIVMFFILSFFFGVCSAEIVRGMVTDYQKKPLANSKVIAVNNQEFYRLPEDLKPIASAVTDTKGMFSIDVPTLNGVALVASGAGGRITKFPVPKEVAQSRVLGLLLERGHGFDGRVLDADNKPIAGAQVGPVIPGLDTPIKDRLRAIPQWTVTDAEGKFRVDGLVPDLAYGFLVQKDGYETINRELAVGRDSLEVVMPKGGYSFSGELYAKGAKADAFAGVDVRANGNGFDVYVKTDEKSHFKFSGIPAGTFSVEAINLKSKRAGKVVVVEMPKSDGSSVSLEMSSGYFVEGVALDAETDQPVGSVPLLIGEVSTTTNGSGVFRLGPYYEAMAFNPKVSEDDGWQLVGVTMDNEYSASDGFQDLKNIKIKVRRKRIFDVKIENFESTTQTVIVTAMSESGKSSRLRAVKNELEFPVFTGGSYLLFASSGEFSSELTSYTLTTETSIPVNLKLGKSGGVTGRLVMDNTQETTRVMEFSVALHPDGVKGKSGDLAVAEPTKDGYFRFVGLPTGKVQLDIENATKTRKMTVPVTVRSGEVDLKDIHWNAGNRLVGRVRTEAGLAIPAAKVMLRDEDGNVQDVSADVDGVFQLEDLPKDTVPFLTVDANGYLRHQDSNIQLPQDAYTVVLKKEGVLSVKVSSAGVGEVWKVSLIRMRPWGSGGFADQLMGQPVVIKEITGNEVIELSVPDSGVYYVVATLGGEDEKIAVSHRIEWNKEVPEGQSVDLTLGRGGVKGSVGQVGQEIEVVAVNNAIPEETDKKLSEFSLKTKDGSYSFASLPPGSYLITANGDGYSAAAINVEVKSGETVTANLESPEPITLAGVVTLAGEPMSGMDITLLSETDQQFAQRVEKSNSQGQFSFENLLPDTYQVRVVYKDKDGELSSRRSVVVKKGETPATITLDMTPPKPAVLTGGESIGLSKDSPVQLMNKETRQMFAVKWDGANWEASAPAGNYEVWNGDSPAGHLVIDESGKGTISK